MFVSNLYSLYLAGRLHKPVTVLTPGLTDAFTPTGATPRSVPTADGLPPAPAALAGLPGALRGNLRQALALALLSLPPVFAEEQLWAALTAISYTGDVRTALAAEAPGKVLAIARGSRALFRRLYGPLLAEAGVVVLQVADALAGMSSTTAATSTATAGATGSANYSNIEAARDRLCEVIVNGQGVIGGLSADVEATGEFVLVQPVTAAAGDALIHALPPRYAQAARDAMTNNSKADNEAARTQHKERVYGTDGVEYARGLTSGMARDVEHLYTAGRLGAGGDAARLLRRRAGAAAAAGAVAESAVRRSSAAQLVKGVVSAGVGRSLQYAAAKLAKGVLGKVLRK